MHVSRQRLVSRAASLLRTAVMIVGIAFGVGVLDGDGEWVPRELAPSTNVHAHECPDDGGGGDQGERPECDRGGGSPPPPPPPPPPRCSWVIVSHVCCVDLVTGEYHCQPVYEWVCD